MNTVKPLPRFQMTLETAAFIVIKQTPNGSSIKRYSEVPEAFKRYCLIKAIHN